MAQQSDSGSRRPNQSGKNKLNLPESAFSSSNAYPVPLRLEPPRKPSKQAEDKATTQPVHNHRRAGFAIRSLCTRPESQMPCRKGPGHSRVNEENKTRVAPRQRWLSKGGKGQDREALAKLFWKSSPPGQEPCLMWPEPSGVFNEPGVVMICRNTASASDTFIGYRCTSRKSMHRRQS